MCSDSIGAFKSPSHANRARWARFATAYEVMFYNKKGCIRNSKLVSTNV